MERQILNEKEAANYIGMSVSYLQHARCYGATRNQTLGPDYIKLGRTVRYRIDDLRKWLEVNTITESCH